MDTSYDISIIRQRYREVFTAAAEDLQAQIDALWNPSLCVGRRCHPEPLETVPDPFELYAEDCGYRRWQQASLAVIEQEIAQSIVSNLNGIQAKKETIACHQCGVCCRLASSEFTMDELQLKAKEGDSFAQQFTSIFLPYESNQAAREAFPEIVNAVVLQAGSEEAVHFYHCQHIGEDNRCMVYGTPKRPPICSSYPDTPLTFIYKNCAWKPWQNESQTDALRAHALIELCSHYSGKLKAALLGADQ